MTQDEKNQVTGHPLGHLSIRARYCLIGTSVDEVHGRDEGSC